MDTKIYNIHGKEVGSIALPEALFGLPWNADLMHQVVTSMHSSARAGSAHTKGRGEVRGGGRKPWKQKGTGRARHGSSRSPIWVGGGVTHGPKSDKNYARKVNRQAGQKALLVALSQKLRDGQVILLDKLEMQAPKTKEAAAVLATLSKTFVGLARRKSAALIALPAVHKPTVKSFANFGNVEVSTVASLNPAAVLGKKYLVIADPRAALEVLGRKKVATRVVSADDK